MNNFDIFNFNNSLKSRINSLGFEKPTLIQEKSIPLILEGKDVIGLSATGSGKTIAFGSGAVQKSVRGGGVQVLILTPTRELAEQVKVSIAQLSNDLKVIAVYGGVSINPQFDDLKKAEIVVATPGRFKDHLERGSVDTSNIKMAVLDEADRMLDMGFIDDIEDILKQIPGGRQTLLFSATIPPPIEKLANKYLDNPSKVVATRMVDPSKLRQVYYNVRPNQKLSLLVHLLKNDESDLSMVFCNTRRSVDMVTQTLKINKVSCTAIHGGFTQNKRSKSLEMFNDRVKGALICTDVAARGLDIDSVSHVYNFELPPDSNSYVHRIGRTARAGKEGLVVNLLDDRDHENFGRIEQGHSEYNIERVDLPSFERVKVVNPNSRFGGRSRGGFRGRRSGGKGSGRSSGRSS